jgi:hypothetical protein
MWRGQKGEGVGFGGVKGCGGRGRVGGCGGGRRG